MKQYDHSFHAFIQGVILIGFAMLILGLILTGNIIYYIAPIMMPFIYFSVVSFFVLGIVQVFRSTAKEDAAGCSSCEHDHQIKGPSWLKVTIYGIFILPIIFGFTFPDRALDSSVAANRGIQYGSGLYTNSSSSDANSSQATASAESSETSRADEYLADPDSYIASLGGGELDTNGENSNQEVLIGEDGHYTIEDLYDEDWFDEYYVELAQELIEQDVITVTEKNYLDVMTVLDIYLNDFVGKELEIKGFAYRERDFDDNQIVAARFSMTCCTADSAVYGTLIQSDQAASFDEDTWFFAVGTIEKGDYHGQSIAVLVDAYLHEVDEPDSPYVYPSY